jgi:hypothetical protein
MLDFVQDEYREETLSEAWQEFSIDEEEDVYESVYGDMFLGWFLFQYAPDEALENEEEEEIDLMEGEEEWNSIVSQGGHYASEETDEDDSEFDEPSLAEIAGDIPDEEEES